ncbi:hypothetical protein QQP08_005977 [Theobroma cacao]|nr:hypothetical protein QQP08_005977 [Theobroma cacao]
MCLGFMSVCVLMDIHDEVYLLSGSSLYLVHYFQIKMESRIILPIAEGPSPAQAKTFIVMLYLNSLLFRHLISPSYHHKVKTNRKSSSLRSHDYLVSPK